MRWLLVTISSIGLLICSGCMCVELSAFSWAIEGRVVDAESGQPLRGDITAVLLFRDGIEIGRYFSSSLISSALDIDGGFLVAGFVDAGGGCGFLGYVQRDESASEPPDEIEIVILREEGGEISILLSVSEENIAESGEIDGFPLDGGIDLGLIEVSGG